MRSATEYDLKSCLISDRTPGTSFLHRSCFHADTSPRQIRSIKASSHSVSETTPLGSNGPSSINTTTVSAQVRHPHEMTVHCCTGRRSYLHSRLHRQRGRRCKEVGVAFVPVLIKRYSCRRGTRSQRVYSQETSNQFRHRHRSCWPSHREQGLDCVAIISDHVSKA